MFLRASNGEIFASATMCFRNIVPRLRTPLPVLHSRLVFRLAPRTQILATAKNASRQGNGIVL